MGQPLYPAPGEKAPRLNTGLADEQAHDHLSRLVWSGDSSQLGFVDAHHGKVKVVVVPVPADTSRPLPVTSAPLEGLGAICLRGSNPDDCTTVPQEAVTLGFEPSNKALKLQMVERTLFPAGYAKVIPLAGFKAAK